MRKYIHFRGKKIFYSDKGSGNAVVLIHGYLETGDVWNSFAEKLSRSFRVIIVDLPGHGHSDIYDETHSMEFLAEVINGLLTTMGLNKAFLVGHSLGGYISLAFLELFPDKLSGYSLFHSHPFADTEEIKKKRDREILIVNAGKKFLMYPDNVRRMFADRNIEKFNEALERSKKIASGIRGEGITSVLRGMMARPSRSVLFEKGIVPCLWILGSMDNYIPCNAMQERVKLPSNAQLVVLENSGHLGFIEEEKKSLEVLTEFIRRINQ